MTHTERNLRRRVNQAIELVKDAIGACISEEKLGSIDGAIWSESFRTGYFEKILEVLDPSYEAPPPRKVSRDNTPRFRELTESEICDLQAHAEIVEQTVENALFHNQKGEEK